MARRRFSQALLLLVVFAMLASCGAQGSAEGVAKAWTLAMAAGDCGKAEALMPADSGLLKDGEKGDCFRQYPGCMTRGYFWLGKARIDRSVAREYELFGRTWTDVTLVGEFEVGGPCRSVPADVNPYELLPQVETTGRIVLAVEKLNGRWYVSGAR